MVVKKYKILVFLTLCMEIVLILTALIAAYPVQAQTTQPPPGNGCNSCHENLYYLHDTGKWLCQCAQQMTCTCCHGGNPDVYTEDEAHAGMELYPTRNDAAACQNCHLDDYATRIETFANKAGISPVHPPLPTPTSLAYISDPASNEKPITGRLMQSLEPWRQIGLRITGVILMVLIFFGYRCWRSDCLVKTQN